MVKIKLILVLDTSLMEVKIILKNLRKRIVYLMGNIVRLVICIEMMMGLMGDIC